MTPYSIVLRLAGLGLAQRIKPVKLPDTDREITNDRGTERHYINYGATFYQGENCTGADAGRGPIVNFGCTNMCWPVSGARSVLVQAKHYDEIGNEVDLNHYDTKYRFIENGGYYSDHDVLGNTYSKVQMQGPVVSAYYWGECLESDYVQRAWVPNGWSAACNTFEKPVHSVHMRFLRECVDRGYDALDPVQDQKPPEVTHFGDGKSSVYEDWVNQAADRIGHSDEMLDRLDKLDDPHRGNKVNENWVNEEFANDADGDRVGPGSDMLKGLQNGGASPNMVRGLSPGNSCEGRDACKKGVAWAG